MKNLFKKINSCRIENDKNLLKIADIGPLTLTGTFLKNKNDKIPSTPLSIVYSKKSHLLQLEHNYSQKQLFGENYGYRSSLNDSMKNHLMNKSKILSKKLNLKKGDSILDIGSNDGTFLNSFQKNINKYGVDPTGKKFKKYYDKNIKLIPKLFDDNVIKNKKIKFKLISSIAMFYDLPNPRKFCSTVGRYLDKEGIFHVEVAYLPDILKKFSFDTFCQEHLTYFSFLSFHHLIKQTPFKITDFSRNSINGGSINFNLAFKDSKIKIKNTKIEKLIKYEKNLNIHKVKTYKKFFNEIKFNAKKINSLIANLKKKNKKIYGFGASTKGNVILQISGLNSKFISGIYDVNPFKFGRYTPGSKIKIKNEKDIFSDKPDYLLLLIWHFSKTLKLKIKKFKNLKLIYIWPFPNLKLSKK